MTEQPAIVSDCLPYVEKDAPEFVAWVEMRNWRLSREWLNAHTRLITPRVAGNMLRAAGAARARGERETANSLALYAHLLDYALHISVDAAYEKLVGDEALEDADPPTQAVLLTQIRDWMNTVTWGESRAYLEGHLAIISVEAESLIRDTYHQLGDGDERATIREHLSILRLVREYGITQGYQRFMLER